jgi:hypothetical protein
MCKLWRGLYLGAGPKRTLNDEMTMTRPGHSIVILSFDHLYARRSMPSFFNFEFSVVRFMPRRAAAPLEPAIGGRNQPRSIELLLRNRTQGSAIAYAAIAAS